MRERIIFYPEIVAFGGGERILLALSRYLHGRQVAHRVVSYYQDIDLARYADWPLSVTKLEPPRQGLRKASTLGRFLRGLQSDSSTTALLIGLQAALHAGALQLRRYALMILDTPSLLTPPGTAGRSRLAAAVRRCITERVIARGMRRAGRVIVTTHYMADELRHLYGVRAAVARQGGLTPRGNFRRRRTERGRPLQLLTVNRLEANKRIDWILDALARPGPRPTSDPPAWHLDIVGDGSQASALKRQALECNLAGRVTFHGQVSDGALESLLDRAHLFLMPARQGYGLPALEALARGIPVVVHRQSGVSEILEGSPWAELIDGDAENLRHGIARMMDRIARNSLEPYPLPQIPTEEQWAGTVCRLCGWDEGNDADRNETSAIGRELAG